MPFRSSSIALKHSRFLCGDVTLICISYFTYRSNFYSETTSKSTRPPLEFFQVTGQDITLCLNVCRVLANPLNAVPTEIVSNSTLDVFKQKLMRCELYWKLAPSLDISVIYIEGIYSLFKTGCIFFLFRLGCTIFSHTMA